MTEGSSSHAGRDSGLELLRIVCMLLIVGYHMVGGTQDWIEYPHEWTWNLVAYHSIGLWGQAAVLCFVMITGYFMIGKAPRLSKTVRLAVEVWFYSIVLSAVMVWTGRAEWDWDACRATLLPLLSREYWFVTDYILLLLISPVLNRMLRALPRRVFGYGLVVSMAVAYACSGLMEFEYLGSLPFLILFYSLAAYMRLYPSPIDRSRRLWPVVLVLCLLYGVLLMRVMNGVYQGTAEPLLDTAEDPQILWFIGGSILLLAVLAVAPIPRKGPVLAAVSIAVLLLSYWAYMPYRGLDIRGFVEERWSVLMGLAAVSMFLTFRNAGIPRSRTVNWMAAGVLGVYLIHEHWAVKGWMWSELFDPGMLADRWFVPSMLAALVCIVVACILVDRLRDLLLFSPVARLRPVVRLSWRLDAWLEEICPVGDGGDSREQLSMMDGKQERLRWWPFPVTVSRSGRYRRWRTTAGSRSWSQPCRWPCSCSPSSWTNGRTSTTTMPTPGTSWTA